jgi:hypothetical protein
MTFVLKTFVLKTFVLKTFVLTTFVLTTFDLFKFVLMAFILMIFGQMTFGLMTLCLVTFCEMTFDLLTFLQMTSHQITFKIYLWCFCLNPHASPLIVSMLQQLLKIIKRNSHKNYCLWYKIECTTDYVNVTAIFNMAAGAKGQFDLSKISGGHKLEVLGQALYGYGYSTPWCQCYKTFSSVVYEFS